MNTEEQEERWHYEVNYIFSRQGNIRYFHTLNEVTDWLIHQVFYPWVRVEILWQPCYCVREEEGQKSEH